MFRACAVQAMGKEQHNSTLTEPFRCECLLSAQSEQVEDVWLTLRGGDERIDHYLRAIEEVSELREGEESQRQKSSHHNQPLPVPPRWVRWLGVPN